jgi:hypothetical protein
MAETPQQYIERILGNLGENNARKVHTATPKHLKRLLKGASPAQLRKRPAPDKWSVTEILAHLADVEIVLGWRVRSILGAPGTPIQAFDQDAWVEAGHYAKRNPRKSLQHFETLREMNLALYDSLAPEQWECHGMHAERGKETVAHILRLMAGHDINHLRQIEQILASNSKRKKSKHAK